MDYQLDQYNTFAELYNRFMNPSLYEQWKEYITNRTAITGAKILDLGCGAGHLGVRLAKEGAQYVGLDLSEEMLTQAATKQQEQNVAFPLVQGDMRDLDGFGLFDGIVSFCDSLCYLTNDGDWLRVFSEVFNHLTDSGIFLFDIHSLYQMAQYDGFSYHDIEADQILLWDSFSGDVPYSCEHYLTIMKSMDNKIYQRFDEVHVQRTYPIEVVIEQLKKAGFSKINVIAEFGQDVKAESRRLFFEVRK
ncbi:class I SAM-dependent DNA methyltransferase [Allofustis seminis]|uniref:class I SAM-dependent DNA methyltransferase n=1 Tax=Allofustis seminis TaxID=166939 RepID=UPI00037EC263|nr:class I SAM-dependent methyltransferase [Allofustis seminis]